MRPASQPMWALMAVSAHLGAVARAAGVLDIGLAFPRANETYAPKSDFPIVFALQNSRLSEHLKPTISFRIVNLTEDVVDALVDSTHVFDWTSASENDPYLLWSHLRAEVEGKLRIIWKPHWSACDESGDEVLLVRNRTDENFLVDFEIRADGGQEADLVAATSGASENCPNEGVGIEVTDKTLEASTVSLGRETCAVLGSWSTAPAASNPCRVKIDNAAVESIQAAVLEKKCRGHDPPEECPKEDLAHPRLAAAGVATLVAVFGAVALLA